MDDQSKSVRTDHGIMRKQMKKTFKNDYPVFFIQVGANDGKMEDPLHELIVKNKNWRGIFIEPLPNLFEQLKMNYGEEQRFIFENIAIDNNIGRRKLFYFSDSAKEKFGDRIPPWYYAIGSFERKHLCKLIDESVRDYIVEREVPCLTLQEILNRHKVPALDLLQIDTEGFDYQVLKQLDFSRYHPAIIIFEHVHLSADEKMKALDLLRSHDYKVRILSEDIMAFR